MKYYLILLIFVNICSFSADVLIMTQAYNQPDFIEMQVKGFRKFLVDDYEFVVFNDAKIPTLANEIAMTCKNLGIRCIPIPQQIHTSQAAGDRHSDCIKYSLDRIGFAHEGIVCIIDSDMFLIKPFSISKFLNEFDIAAVDQFREPNIHYLWPGLVFINMKTIPNKQNINWKGGKINGIPVDTGGQTYHYVKNNPLARVEYINNYSTLKLLCPTCQKNKNLLCTHNNQILEEAGFDPTGPIRQLIQNENWPLFLDFHFVHFYAGSWLPNRPSRKITLKQFFDLIE